VLIILRKTKELSSHIIIGICHFFTVADVISGETSKHRLRFKSVFLFHCCWLSYSDISHRSLRVKIKTRLHFAVNNAILFSQYLCLLWQVVILSMGSSLFLRSKNEYKYLSETALGRKASTRRIMNKSSSTRQTNTYESSKSSCLLS
jgi:hypothetical protein